jgi:hypothetical protein
MVAGTQFGPGRGDCGHWLLLAGRRLWGAGNAAIVSPATQGSSFRSSRSARRVSSSMPVTMSAVKIGPCSVPVS